MRFSAEEPGHYPCEIVLRGSDDVRVFRIECTVNPEGSTAEINFCAPVHQNVTQEIPLVGIDCLCFTVTDCYNDLVLDI